MMQWIVGPLRKYAQFSGRARRTEYWVFIIFVALLSLGADWIDRSRGSEIIAGPFRLFGLIVFLLFLLPSIAAGVRRLHDGDRSGWWLLLAYVPWLVTLAVPTLGPLGLVAAGALLAGGITLIILMLLPGTSGDNRFGSDPKGAEASLG